MDSTPPMKSMFPSIYRHVIHVITLFFHGDYDENVFFPIQSHQRGLERRERQPGGVQQEKLDVMFRRCDTSYNPIFLWRIQWKCFHNDLVVSTPLKTYILIYNMPKTTKLTP